MADLRNTNFAMTGFDNLFKVLAEVKDDVRFKGGRSALRKTASVLADRVKERAAKINDPTTSEEIAKNVAIRWSSRRFKATGDLSFRVGIQGGAKQYSNSRANQRRGRAGKEYETGGDKSNPGGDTWYWRLVEFGTEHSAARPFMRPAIEASQQVLPTIFATEYERALERVIARTKRAAR